MREAPPHRPALRFRTQGRFDPAGRPPSLDCWRDTNRLKVQCRGRLAHPPRHLARGRRNREGVWHTQPNTKHRSRRPGASPDRRCHAHHGRARAGADRAQPAEEGSMNGYHLALSLAPGQPRPG